MFRQTANPWLIQPIWKIFLRTVKKERNETARPFFQPLAERED